MNIEFDDDVDDISTISVVLSNVKTKASFNGVALTTSLDDSTEDIELNYELDSDKRVATITARLLPGSLSENSSLKLNIGGDIYNLEYNQLLESGKEYVHSVTISEEEDESAQKH